MTTRIRFLGEVPASTVAGTFNTADVSLTIASASGQPSTFPFDAVISRTVPAKRERIRVGGMAGAVYNTITRAIDGTTAKLHDVGETVELCISASYLDELGQFLGGTTGDLYYYGGTNLARLGIGATNEILRVTGGLPDWQVLSTVFDAVYGTTNEQVLKRASGAWAAGFTVVPTFATTAAATAAGANVDAALIYANTGDAGEGLYTYNGTSWRAVSWNAPWGRVAGTTSTAATTGITTATDVMTVTWTAVANRIYRITSYVTFQQITGTGLVTTVITTNTPTTVQTHEITMSAAFKAVSNFSTEVTPSAGSVTYRTRISTGGGTLTLDGSAAQLHTMTVDDVGPAAGAPS